QTEARGRRTWLQRLEMATELTLPALSEGVESAEVLEVKVSEGDTVRAGQILAVLQAEKASAELEAPQDGRVVKVLIKSGDTLHVGQAYCQFEPGAMATKSAELPKLPAKAAPAAPPQKLVPVAHDGHTNAKPLPVSAPGAVIAAGPATRMLARRLGVDLQQVHGTGRNGRITSEDVEIFVRELAKGPGLASGATPMLPDFSRWGEVEGQVL